MRRLQYLPSWKGIWKYLRDPDSAKLPKAMLVAAITYLFFPFDLIPDFAVVIGWLDDLGLNVLAIYYVLSTAKKYEHANLRKKAEYVAEHADKKAL